MAATGYPLGWPVFPCPIDYPLMPFFCVVGSRQKMDCTGIMMRAVS